MPEFNRGHAQIDAAGLDGTRATARLSGLEIEIVHRRAVEDDAERRRRSRPSVVRSEANPFAFWAQVARLTWQPWLVAGRALPLLLPLALPWPSGDGPSRSAQERDTPG